MKAAGTIQLGLVLCIMLLVVTAAMPKSHALSAADESPSKTVGIIPLRDLGPSVELGPLSRAISRMLTTDLAGYEAVSYTHLTLPTKRIV